MASGLLLRKARAEGLALLGLGVVCLVLAAHLVSCLSHRHAETSEPRAATGVYALGEPSGHAYAANASTADRHGDHERDVRHAPTCIVDAVPSMLGASKVHQALNVLVVPLPLADMGTAHGRAGWAQPPSLDGFSPERRRCLFGVHLLIALCVSRI